MEKIETHTVNREGVTLSALIWGLFQKQPEGFIEIVLEQNPGLALMGPIIPIGTVVEFPIERLNEAQERIDVVRIFD